MGAELGRSGEHPVIQHPLHVCHVHGHEELEDPWNLARPGLRPRFLDPAYASQKFRMSFRVDRNTRCSNSSAARLSTAPRSAGTSSDWEPSAFETRAESIGMCRKRSCGTSGRWRRPASAAVCRIPCLILCLAYVASGRRAGPRQCPVQPRGHVRHRAGRAAGSLLIRRPHRQRCCGHRRGCRRRAPPPDAVLASRRNRLACVPTAIPARVPFPDRSSRQPSRHRRTWP